MTKRESIIIQGQAPNKLGIPHVVRYGDLLVSSSISGLYLPDGSVVLEPERQIENALSKLKAYVEGAGASLDNVGFVNMWLSSKAKKQKDVQNREWSRIFPGENAPARHAVMLGEPSFMDERTHIEVAFIANLAAKREVFNVPGKTPHESPIPDVAKVGNLVFSSVFTGTNKQPNGKTEKHPAKQMANNFERMRAHLQVAGAGLQDLGYVRNYVRYRNMRPLMNDEWKAMFGPTFPDAPARDTFISPQMNEFVEIQTTFRAVTGVKRETFSMSTDWARAHAEPIADICKMGDLYFTSRIGGQEKADGSNEDDPNLQVPNAFQSLDEHLAGSKISKDNVALVEMWVSDVKYMELIDKEWEKAFGTKNAPARVVVLMKPEVAKNSVMKMEIIAHG